MNIPLCKPYLDQQEQLQVRDVLDSGWLIQGSRVAQLERSIRDYVNSGFAVATSSCSTALHLALSTCGIAAGDEVIVPSFTWVATAAAVEQCSAIPIFCDIEREGFNIDPDQIESLITNRTKAILPVSLFGLCADLPQITNIAAKYQLVVVEDAACALGAKIADRHAGTFGQLGCFSFHPRKSITTGEGGMIVGSSSEDENILRSMRSHGLCANENDPDQAQPYYLADVDKLGYNYRMSDIHAAVGLAQFDKLGKIIKRRQEIAAIYDREFADLELLAVPTAPERYRHTYQSYVLQLKDKQGTIESAQRVEDARNQFMQMLSHAGIATRPGTQAVHTLSYYRQKYALNDWDFPNSLRAMRHSIAIPIYPDMSSLEVEYVVTNLKSIYSQVIEKLSPVTVNLS